MIMCWACVYLVYFKVDSRNYYAELLIKSAIIEQFSFLAVNEESQK